ncbi:YbaB/EbfC family DNA-binding protein [Paraburkholderia kururiensis]
MEREDIGVFMKRQRRAAWRGLIEACAVMACAWLTQTHACAQTADAAASVASSVPSSVPQAWLRYAQLVSTQFQTSLEADNDASKQLHQYLEERIVNATADAPPPAIVVRAWIGESGAVSKLQFDSLGNDAADAALRTLLIQHVLPEPPPADMLQPLRVRLRLVANPEAGPEASSAAR